MSSYQGWMIIIKYIIPVYTWLTYLWNRWYWQISGVHINAGFTPSHFDTFCTYERQIQSDHTICLVCIIIHETLFPTPFSTISYCIAILAWRMPMTLHIKIHWSTVEKGNIPTILQATTIHKNEIVIQHDDCHSFTWRARRPDYLWPGRRCWASILASPAELF